MEKQIEESAVLAKIDFAINMWKDPSNEMDGLHTLETLRNEILALSQQSQQPDSKGLEELKEDFYMDFTHGHFDAVGGDGIDGKKIFDYFVPFLSPQSNPVVDTDELREKFENWYYAEDERTLLSGDEFTPSHIFDWFLSNLTNTSEGDKWISVEERLPELRDRYLCFIEEQNDLGLSKYVWNCYYGGEGYGFADNGIKYKVTHWQPITPPINK